MYTSLPSRPPVYNEPDHSETYKKIGNLIGETSRQREQGKVNKTYEQSRTKESQDGGRTDHDPLNLTPETRKIIAEQYGEDATSYFEQTLHQAKDGSIRDRFNTIAQKGQESYLNQDFFQNLRNIPEDERAAYLANLNPDDYVQGNFIDLFNNQAQRADGNLDYSDSSIDLMLARAVKLAETFKKEGNDFTLGNNNQQTRILIRQSDNVQKWIESLDVQDARNGEAKRIAAVMYNQFYQNINANPKRVVWVIQRINEALSHAKVGEYDKAWKFIDEVRGVAPANSEETNGSELLLKYPESETSDVETSEVETSTGASNMASNMASTNGNGNFDFDTLANATLGESSATANPDTSTTDNKRKELEDINNAFKNVVEKERTYQNTDTKGLKNEMMNANANQYKKLEGEQTPSTSYETLNKGNAQLDKKHQRYQDRINSKALKQSNSAANKNKYLGKEMMLNDKGSEYKYIQYQNILAKDLKVRIDKSLWMELLNFGVKAREEGMMGIVKLLNHDMDRARKFLKEYMDS